MVAVEAALALEQEVAEPKGEAVTVTVDPAGQVEPLALAVTVTVDGVAVDPAGQVEPLAWAVTVTVDGVAEMLSVTVAVTLMVEVDAVAMTVLVI